MHAQLLCCVVSGVQGWLASQWEHFACPVESRATYRFMCASILCLDGEITARKQKKLTATIGLLVHAAGEHSIML